MKNHSARADLGVFDFNEEIDSVPTRWTPKCGRTKFSGSPNDKYSFLQQAACGSVFRPERSVDPQCVDVDAIDDDDDCRDDDVKQSPHAIPPEDSSADMIKCSPLGTALENSASEPLDELIPVSGAAVEQRPHFNEDILHSESFSVNTGLSIRSPADVSPGNAASCSTVRESPSSNGSIGAASSDVVDNSEESCPSTPTSVLMENNVAIDRQDIFHSCNDIEMEDADTTVVLHADYVSYRNKYLPSSLILFSNNSFKIEALSVDDKVEATQSEWHIDDIIDICAQWSRATWMATIRLRVMTKESYQAGSPGISDIEQLEAVIYDPSWLHKKEKIMLLSLKYKDSWINELNINKGFGGDVLPIDCEFRGGPYFPDFDGPFGEVIYPEGDTDAVSISKRDVDLLQPETFVNDTIIDFYIKYLKNKIPSGEMHRFHFFNSFFFRKLADLDKNPSSAFEGKAAFQRVRKWTRKFDLFGKDYIFIPVNYNLHWSLIIICHPGEVADFEDRRSSKPSRVPCILHMDSIKGNHTGLENLIQSYLWEEWKERRKETSEDVASKFLNFRFLSLELPQQENCYDCGLFLLHYVELFVAEAPVDFDPFKITKYSNFLTADWFLPSEVSLKRAYIQRLIYDLLKNCDQSSAPTSCGNEHQSSELPVISEDDIAIELVSKRSMLKRKVSGNSQYDLPGQGIGMDLISPPFRSCDNAYEAMRGSFQAEPYGVGSSCSRLANAMSDVEEEADQVHEDHPFIPSVIASEYMGFLHEAEPSNAQYPVSDHDEEEDGSSPVSEYHSEDSELELAEETFDPGRVSFDQNEIEEQATCSLGEKVDYVTDTVASICDKGVETSAEESELEKLQSCKNEGDPSLSPCRDDVVFESHREPCVNEQLVVDDSLDSDDKREAKRRRLSPSCDEDGDGEVARCESREVQL
ncbi:hypothetical protein Dimus_006298 [Dionaea muscipula]